MSIVVFGSVNMDLVAQAIRLPIPGETVNGHTFFTVSGGKGANQAVAAAKLGVPTKLFGRVGSDVFGESLRTTLSGYGVDVAGVMIRENTPSGIAMIALDDQAENMIIVVPGANATLDSTDLERLDATLRRTKILMLQLEISFPMVTGALALAHKRGVMTIFDPAPARPLPLELYPQISIITPNATEAAALVGFPISSEDDAARAANILLERGVKKVVIKMGSRGAYWAESDGANGFLKAFKVDAIDTVAAGDAFNGAMAVALTEGHSFAEAVRWGAGAGAISTTKHGAQPSMPDRLTLEHFLFRS